MTEDTAARNDALLVLLGDLLDNLVRALR